MNRHGSMNRVYRLLWSQVRSAWVPAAETAKGQKKSKGRIASTAHAMAAPIPRPAPVTNTILPFMSIIGRIPLAKDSVSD